MTDLRVFPVDVQSIPFAGKRGVCMRGARVWAAQHDIDWASFVRDGIPASVLLATGDPMAEAAVNMAKARQEGAVNG